MQNSVTNLLIAGVGGQGILLVSEILAEVCMQAGYDVKKSEVHGMAQRGGSVTSHVRFGTKVYSPLIEQGRADLLLSFEPLEAMRWSGFLKPDGTILVNDQRVEPMTVTSGRVAYPERLMEQLKTSTHRVIVVDGLGIARMAGNLRTVNIALLGALSNYLDLDKSLWIEAIRHRVPPKTLEANMKAFEFGRAQYATHRTA